jgi:hypothetical protein
VCVLWAAVDTAWIDTRDPGNAGLDLPALYRYLDSGQDRPEIPRMQVLSEGQWAGLLPLLPSSDGVRGRPFRDHRQVVEGIVFRCRTGCAWRDLPAEFGPWQTVWKRHARFSRDGT